MSCQELVELVTEYLEGALDAGEAARFEAHLAVCDGCRAYVEQVRVTARLVGEAGRLEQRPELAGLLAAFRDFRRGA